MERTSSSQRREEAKPSRPDTVRLQTRDVFVDAPDQPQEAAQTRPRLGQTPTAPPGRTPQIEGGRSSTDKPQMQRIRTEMPPPPAPSSATRRPDTSRRHSVATRPSPPLQQQQQPTSARDERERAAQDVADEREYVVVEKKAVEMNALADEMQTSPRIHGHRYSAGSQQRPRQIAGSAPANNQIATTRAVQAGSANKPDHLRRTSFERRAKATGSASSAIAKALSMASGRLMSLGLSPPIGRTGSAPASMPIYSPFPPYPSQASPLLLEDGRQSGAPLDEDTQALQNLEETATRSDVVHGFAQVKFLQIAPAQPSTEQGLGVQGANLPTQDEGSDLPPEALMMVCEEALVLYVKALNLLSQAMDVAGIWWQRRHRGDATDSSSTSPKASKAVHPRITSQINGVVQWVRGRYNETLAKAEFVSLKLVEAQKLLPPEHPCHPNNRSALSAGSSTATAPQSAQASGAGNEQGGAPGDVYISPGVTAERIMYQRAVEMSRTAAINELMGQNLHDCEIGYVTAIRMLEVVLETSGRESASESVKQERSAAKDDADEVDNLDPEDRESVLNMLQGTKNRLYALRKKMQMLARRNSAQAVPQRSPRAKPAALAPGHSSAR